MGLMQRRKGGRRVKWLSRQMAMPGPCLTLCLSQQEFNTICRPMGLPDTPFISGGFGGRTHFVQRDDGEMTAIVCIGLTEDHSAVEIAALLVHEAVHVWQHYCESINEHDPASEQEAYGIQSLSQSLMAEYARRVGKWA